MTSEGARLLRAFEAIVSDERRLTVLQHVDREAAADLEENPNVDLARASPLSAEADDSQP